MAALACLFLVMPASARQVQQTPGEAYLQADQSTRLLISTGVLVGLKVAKSADSGETPYLFQHLMQCTDRMSPGQLSAIVEAYLKTHPVAWSYYLNVSLAAALYEACP